MRPRRWFVPWLFALPAIVIAVCFYIAPFINTVVLAFTNSTALRGGSFTGFDNFTRIWSDPAFHTALGNTLLYVVVVVPLMVVLPLLLAVFVQPAIPGIGFFRAIFYSPVVASMVVVGLIWSWMFQSNGVVNWVLRTLRIVSEPVPFLTDSTLLLFACMFVTVWKGLGYYMVIYLSALANVPADLYEAAQLDGAGAARRLWSVTVPGVRSTMALVGLLSTIGAFKVFSEVYVISSGTAGPGGGARTLVYYIREVGLGLTGQMGYASAISLVLFLLTIGFSITYVVTTREGQSS